LTITALEAAEPIS